MRTHQNTAAFISHTSIECANAFEQVNWWKQDLGYHDVPEHLRPSHRSPDAEVEHLIFLRGSA